MKNKRSSKRIMVALLACTMLFSAVMAGCGEDDKNGTDTGNTATASVTAESKTSAESTDADESKTSAESTDSGESSATEESSEEEYTPGTIIDSGKCGDNLTWEFDENGVLVISGEGNMDDYLTNYAPWHKYSENIQRIILKNGVTSIGKSSLNECPNLKKISIPDSVTLIDDYALKECTSIEEITVPDGITEISFHVFKGCTSLKSFTVPDGVTMINFEAFDDCTSLTSITIPESVETIYDLFYGCDNLTLHCKSGSYAETFAMKHGIPFIAE